MDPQVHNGSGVRGKHFTDLLVYHFLHHCPHSQFHQELKALGRGLPGHASPREPESDELQTDGNQCSSFAPDDVRGPDSETQEEAIWNVARQLAQIGDQMERYVSPSLVQHLVTQLRRGGLSEEGRRAFLATAVDQALQACPQDVEAEKTKLLLAMLLVKKVADHTPSLLHTAFCTTVNFINQNLLAYLRNLVGNELD